MDGLPRAGIHARTKRFKVSARIGAGNVLQGNPGCKNAHGPYLMIVWCVLVPDMPQNPFKAPDFSAKGRDLSINCSDHRFPVTASV
jgi:hypothetical protein